MSTAIFANYYIPGLNVAFLFSLFLTIALALLAVPVAKRRPIGTPLSWGEAMVASVWAFLVMFLAYGIVPHWWLTHASSELQWRKDKILMGPGVSWLPKFGRCPAVGTCHLFQRVPFTINFSQIGDVIVVVIYVVGLGALIAGWSWWQKRGKSVSTTEVATSAFGRPLVKKG